MTSYKCQGCQGIKKIYCWIVVNVSTTRKDKKLFSETERKEFKILEVQQF